MNYKNLLSNVPFKLLCAALLTLAPLVAPISAQASSIADQTEQANDGAFARYTIKYDKANKSYAITGCCTETWQISSELRLVSN